jgi:pyruvoyl-dependent arginine decarboxylase (PvlArgDC)
MAGYVSEYTRFMQEWLMQHPAERIAQQQGLALWWDRPQDGETLRRRAESRVLRQPAHGANQIQH